MEHPTNYARRMAELRVRLNLLQAHRTRLLAERAAEPRTRTREQVDFTIRNLSRVKAKITRIEVALHAATARRQMEDPALE